MNTLQTLIQVDGPMRIEPNQFAITVFGWYAGPVPISGVTIRWNNQIVACNSEARPDVVAAYPGLQVTGFRAGINFLTLAEPPIEDGGHVDLEIRAGDVESKWLSVPVVTGWGDDVSRMRAAIARNAPADLGLGLRSGDDHYRAYVGLPDQYDLSSASAFHLLSLLGLRQDHRLLDVGCGSLRCGRLLIPYLNAGNYLGVEPNGWLVEEGLKNELGDGIRKAKRPEFLFSASPHVLDTAPCSNYALANSIFSHASYAQISDWLQHISACLCSSGALVATFLIGPQDYTGDEWVYPGCIRYRLESMEALAQQHGFRLHMLDWLHLHGQRWALFAKRNFSVECLQLPLTWNAQMERHRS